jgi:MoaA/NifB/PqqE/SkfB family radical SAM enzyme
MRLDDLGVPWGQGPFRRTKRVSLELSNICNYADTHRRCPLHNVTERRVLPERVVVHVLETCRAHDFQGVVAFHMYNEPGIDPRLMRFIILTKELMPRSRVFLLTNGWYLDQGLAEEYERHGVDYLGISVYGDEEAERLARIRLTIPVRRIREEHDDRKGWYSGPPREPWQQPCYYPLYDVCVTHTGTVRLCPYDWQGNHVFGDLERDSLADILHGEPIQAVYEKLSSGIREFDVCRRCGRSRGEPYAEPVAGGETRS